MVVSTAAKRQRSSSASWDEREEQAEICLDSCPRAWDFPLSRGDKVRRLMLLFEAETDSSSAAAADAEDLLRSASKRADELEAEVAKLRARVVELEADHARLAVSEQLPWADSMQPASRGSSMSSDMSDQEMGEVSDSDGEAPPPMAGSRDAPSDNLLAQLLLSAPSVPMVSRRCLGEAMPHHLSSMVTPRCPPPQRVAQGRLSSGRAQAPLGVGCLNLGALQACTPREVLVKSSPEDRLQTHRIAPDQLMAALATPRVAQLSLAAKTGKSTGCVAAVRWGGVDAVDWLRFDPRQDSDALGRCENAIADGEFVLQHGESVQVVRGCSNSVDGRVADSLVIVTSKLRTQKLGNRAGLSTTFSFIAAPGFEICGLVTGADGRVEGVTQHPL